VLQVIIVIMLAYVHMQDRVRHHWTDAALRSSHKCVTFSHIINITSMISLSDSGVRHTMHGAKHSALMQVMQGVGIRMQGMQKLCASACPVDIVHGAPAILR
jgi:hypothetical protein